MFFSIFNSFGWSSISWQDNRELWRSCKCSAAVSVVCRYIGVILDIPAAPQSTACKRPVSQHPYLLPFQVSCWAWFLFLPAAMREFGPYGRAKCPFKCMVLVTGYWWSVYLRIGMGCVRTFLCPVFNLYQRVPVIGKSAASSLKSWSGYQRRVNRPLAIGIAAVSKGDTSKISETHIILTIM